ncbi:hypothetical protein ACNAN0_12490 [Agrilactobacillus fermenti]|uniref:hypothetical protein n=1 Tax=Agrilactobacillus fermenti TaxID=2586909 RepID=UPI001E41CB61|nr:hypothetical protein [Agrilactobacillus fermenti]MCD2255881.1 hypothetical protein [Agrilactobacillus fermenti]
MNFKLASIGSNINKHKIIYYFLLLSFWCILSLIYLYPFVKTHALNAYGGDLPFHLGRIEELYQDLRRGVIIPRISTFTFRQVGGSVNFFYPWIGTYPFALLRFIIPGGVSAYYAGIYLYTVLTFITSYYAMVKFSSNKVRAIIFSVIYVFSAYRFHDMFDQFVLGEALCLTWLPLVFFSFYELLWGDKHYWKLLSISVSLVLFTHVLTFAILIVILALLFIMLFWKIQDKFQRFKRLFWSVLLNISLSMIFWGPMLEQRHLNDLHMPFKGLVLIKGPYESIERAFTYSFYYGNKFAQVDAADWAIIGPVLMLVVLFGWIFIKYVSVKERFIYIVGALLVVLTTSLVPWGLFNSTPIGFLQFPYRLLGISTVFVASYASLLGVMLIQRINKGKQYPLLTLVSITCLVFVPVCVTMVHGRSILKQRSEFNQLSANKSKVKPYSKLSNFEQSRRILPIKYRLTDKNFENIFGYWNGSTLDYFPNAAVSYGPSIMDNKVVINHKYVSVFEKERKVSPNKIEYILSGNKIGTYIDLPLVYIHNDQVLINHKKINKENISNRGTIQFKSADKRTKVVLKYIDSSWERLCTAVSVASWTFLGLVSTVNFFNKKHRKFES